MGLDRNQPGSRPQAIRPRDASAWAASQLYKSAPGSVRPTHGLGVGFEVDQEELRRLLRNLADMSIEARNKLEARAIRQGLGPMRRAMKRGWKSVPVQRESGKRIRYWASRAVQLKVDKYPAGDGKRYGKVFLSYKNKFKSARLAHLLENPQHDYRTSGPIAPDKLKPGQPRTPRAFGRMRTGSRVNHKVFQKYRNQARQAFLLAVRMFLDGFDMKTTRKSIRERYG